MLNRLVTGFANSSLLKLYSRAKCRAPSYPRRVRVIAQRDENTEKETKRRMP